MQIPQVVNSLQRRYASLQRNSPLPRVVLARTESIEHGAFFFRPFASVLLHVATETAICMPRPRKDATRARVQHGRRKEKMAVVHVPRARCVAFFQTSPICHLKFDRRRVKKSWMTFSSKMLYIVLCLSSTWKVALPSSSSHEIK